jgi:hypothetical protein
VFLVRKLSVPGHDELAMGVIASGGIRVLNDDVIRALRLDEDAVGAVAAREWRTLRERELSYRGERSRPRIEGCTVILVDDGLTTGASLRAAVQALNEERPKRLARSLRMCAVLFGKAPMQGKQAPCIYDALRSVGRRARGRRPWRSPRIAAELTAKCHCRSFADGS